MKEEKPPYPALPKKTTVDSKLDLLKFSADVHAENLNKNITSDYTLAKIPETPDTGKRDREAVIEMTNNAYFVANMMRKIKKEKIYAWKGGHYYDGGHYELETQPIRDLDYIDQLSGSTFDAFMNRIHMLMVLNRNVKDNYLLQYLAGIIPSQPEEEETTTRLVDRLKQKLGKKEEEEPDD